MAAKIRTAETDPLWCGQAGCGEFIFQPWVDESGDWKGSDGHRHWPSGRAAHRTATTPREIQMLITAAVRAQARTFIAAEGSDSREETLLRAHRYATARTGTLRPEESARAVAAFTAAVDAQLPRRRRIQAARPVTQYQDFADELLY